jgi:hypothetical protein
MRNVPLLASKINVHDQTGRFAHAAREQGELLCAIFLGKAP